MLNEILKRMGLLVDVTVREDADEVILDCAGEDAGRVIGPRQHQDYCGRGQGKKNDKTEQVHLARISSTAAATRTAAAWT